MNKNRPVNLDLTTIKQPLPAIVSISHRISGVLLLAGVLILMWMLDASLASEESFESVAALLGHPLAKLVVWAVLAALAYHLLAGIRHILMDLGIGEGLESGRLGAKLVIGASAVLIIAAGVWMLW